MTFSPLKPSTKKYEARFSLHISAHISWKEGVAFLALQNYEWLCTNVNQ